jgi:ribosomal protein L37AE/L43A
MSDEFRLPKRGEKLVLKLLPLTPLHTRFVVKRPAIVCAYCRRRLLQKPRDVYYECERCGIPFHDACYLASAPPWEWALLEAEHETDEDMLAAGVGQYIFCCAGCRS